MIRVPLQIKTRSGETRWYRVDYFTFWLDTNVGPGEWGYTVQDHSLWLHPEDALAFKLVFGL